MKSRRKWTDDDFLRLVKISYSWRELAIKLGLCGNGNGCYNTMHRVADRLNVDTSHFIRKRFGSGMTSYLELNPENLLKVLGCVSNPYRKKKLLEWGLLKNICNECGISNEWNGKPLTLQLDHIDGNNQNNELKNLRMLCPNCHTQTETYGSKYVKEKRQNIRPRKVERPSKEELISLIKSKPMTAIGVQYGVSDNAVRKWAMSYDIDFKKIRKTT